MRQITIGPRFEDWQSAARALLRAGVPPGQVTWHEVEHPPLFDRAATSARGAPDPSERAPAIRVPRAFMDLARRVAARRDPERWALLYEALWRIAREDRNLLAQDADPLMRRLHAMAKEPDAPGARQGPRGGAAAVGLSEDEAPAPGAGSFVPAG